MSTWSDVWAITLPLIASLALWLWFFRILCRWGRRGWFD